MKGFSALQLLAAVAGATAATWKNVKTDGGGGFVPGIIFHPKAKGVAYARTDIGGLYRLNEDDSWTPVTDSLSTNERW
jgi:xyloglucan-specific exo-beta-1,4-glucanase